MKSKIVVRLSIATGCVLLVLIGFLAGAYWRSEQPTIPPAHSSPTTPPGTVVNRTELTNPPPPPKAVANPNRVRQNLREGKTYVTHTKGALHVRGTDKDWGIEEVITINYAFEAQIDREIESNDGTTIVELRHFRDLRSLKVECRLEDIRIELGAAGDLLLGGIAVFQPEAAPVAGVIIMQLNGASLKKAITLLRRGGVSLEQLTGLDQKVKAFASVDQLTGKTVRLTYVDGKGVMKVEPIKGQMTAAERDFHMASVLVSDSLIIPEDIKAGKPWSVDGSNFANLMDPSLLARTSGKITLELAPDHIVQNKLCRNVMIAGGSILFDDSDPKIGRIGHFEPTKGSLYFSPEDQIIIQAELSGQAKLDKFSKDHLLFEAKMSILPTLDIRYSCRVKTP